MSIPIPIPIPRETFALSSLRAILQSPQSTSTLIYQFIFIIYILDSDPSIALQKVNSNYFRAPLLLAPADEEDEDEDQDERPTVEDEEEAEDFALDDELGVVPAADVVARETGSLFRQLSSRCK